MPQEVEDSLRRRKYRNPPVIEAVARLQWSQPAHWTFTTPGLAFEQLRELYPEEPRNQATVQAGMFAADGGENPVGSGPGVNAGFELRAGPQRILYSSEGGSQLLGLSPIDLSVHGLPPYEGWESLESRLLAGLERVRPVLKNQNATVSTVGLRYINRIEIPEKAVKFEDYLTVSLDYPPGYPPIVSAVLDRVEMQYPGENVGLAFTVGVHRGSF